jgi:hypothetical protein
VSALREIQLRGPSIRRRHGTNAYRMRTRASLSGPGRRGQRRNAPLPRFLIPERPRYFVLLPRPPACPLQEEEHGGAASHRFRIRLRFFSLPSLGRLSPFSSPSAALVRTRERRVSQSRSRGFPPRRRSPVASHGLLPSVLLLVSHPLPRATSFSRADPPANHRAAVLPLVAGFAFSSYRSP